MPIADSLSNVNFNNWKFLSDKSYAYDTIYFLSKFIRERSENWFFHRSAVDDDLKSYIWLKFRLPRNNNWLTNYYNETVNVLCYSGTVEIGWTWNNKYLEILDDDMLEYISSIKMENAYVYLYLLCYFTLKNSTIRIGNTNTDLLHLYQTYVHEPNADRRESQINAIYQAISSLSTGIEEDDTQRSKQCTKYIMNVMNFINNRYCITRELKENSRPWYRDPHTISVNVPGTKTRIPKDNEYLNHFDFSHVESELDWYLFI